jgi:peptidoglycan/LPS O-acetylase OafA/YrhL
LRRPRGWPALAVLLGAAGLVLLVHALSQDPQPEFELPLAPLFVLVALAALLGPRPGSATVPRS